MSTNFYWMSPGADGIHIGKRSGGGLWSLQGHLDLTDAPVTSWRHWTLLLRLPGSRIFDEYSQEWTATDFITEVEKSTRANRRRQYDWLVELEHHYRFAALHVPEGESPVLDSSEWRTWLDADGFSVTFGEFS